VLNYRCLKITTTISGKGLVVNRACLCVNTAETRKADARGRTEHFVTNLQFPIKVCFLSDRVSVSPMYMHSRKRFPSVNPTCDRDLWPMTLTVEPDLYSVNKPKRQIYRSNVISFKSYHPDRKTHIRQRLL